MKSQLCFMIIVVSQFPVAVKAAAELPHDLREGLAKSAASLSPLEVIWKTTNTTPSVQQFLTMAGYKFPATVTIPLQFFSPAISITRLQDGMRFEEYTGMSANQVPNKPNERVRQVPYGIVYAFDSERVYRGDHEEQTSKAGRSPSLCIDFQDRLAIKTPDDPIAKSRYLSAVGFSLPVNVKNQTRPPKHVILQLLEDGALLSAVRPVVLDSRNCFEITLEVSDVYKSFVVDPALGCAVRKATDTYKVNGRVAEVTECSDFEELRSSTLWLPRRCRISYYTYGLMVPPQVTKEPLLVRSFDVVKLSGSRMPTDDFIVKFHMPGSKLFDSTLPEASTAPDGVVSYRLPANERDLQAAIDEAVGHVGARRTTRILLIMANVIALLLLLGVWIRHRYKTTLRA